MSKTVSVLTPNCSLKGECTFRLPRVLGYPSSVFSNLVSLFIWALTFLCFILYTAASDLFLKYKLDVVSFLLKTFLSWLTILLRMKSEFLTVAYWTLWKLTLCLPLLLDIPLFLFIWLSFSHLGLFLLSPDHPRHLLTGVCVSAMLPLEHLSSVPWHGLPHVLLKVPAHMFSPEKGLPCLTD